MNKKIITTIILIISLLTINLTTITANQTKNNTSFFAEPAALPTWNIGNNWKYDMNFSFIARDKGSKVLDVQASISEMTAEVGRIVQIDGEEHYKLDISESTLKGDLLIPFVINIKGQVKGKFSGNAYINKNTLGMKKFVFNVDGDVTFGINWHELKFDMIMDFKPGFNFLEFPIYPNEKPWDVHIKNASLIADVMVHYLVDIPFHFENYTEFDDTMSLQGIETMTIPNLGTFETYKLGGTWGDPSELYYAPFAGFLVKVKESLDYDNGNITAGFNLDLLDTNYDVHNDPPDQPGIPDGPVSGETDTEYEYSAVTSDPDNDKIQYLFDWGDDTDSGWLEPLDSNNLCSASHTWSSKGSYNVRVKARDTSGVESEWSDPLIVTISGFPFVNFTILHVEKLDEIDTILIPSMTTPEWYYKFSILGFTNTYCNTIDGEYSDDSGDWIHSDTWDPNKEYNVEVQSREIPFKIWLCDKDDPWAAEGGDDLADVSGCNKNGDTNGENDYQEPPKRAAVFHGTYDMVTNTLKTYSENPIDYRDFYNKINEDTYIIRGDDPPDSSVRYENGLKDPENDALMKFSVKDDYIVPNAMIKTVDETNDLWQYSEIGFLGIVTDGAASKLHPYQFLWDFGDGTTSEEQNPKHIYDNFGTYTVTLTVTDALGETSTATLSLNIKQNHAPRLTDGQVTYTGKGNKKDDFTFTVHYYDQDEHIPGKQTVIIDDIEYTLTGEGNNVDYVKKIKGETLGLGEHKYYFSFEDEHGATTDTPEETFKVKKNTAVSKIFGINNLVISFLKRFFRLFPISFYTTH
jgi:PKD repeat protein